ncbi:MAG: 1-phosphofructokinase family hexose kinase [Pseudomonadales bacterium]
MNEQKAAHVLTVTLNPSIDKTFSVERVVPERKLPTSEVRNFPGGGGINVARAICRLGGQAHALWTCGGSTGVLLTELLDAERLHHDPVRVADSVRENLIIKDVSNDQQFRFGLPGPKLSQQERDLWCNSLREHGAGADFVVFSGSLPRGVPVEWYGELVRAAPAGARVVVDTKKDALAAALAVGVYLIKPNIHELEEAVGHELEGDDAIGAAAREVIERGAAEVVLVSMGRGGAMLATADGIHRLSAPSVTPRSKVGAGDSMVGGVITALTRGASIVEAASYGVAAGAAAVMSEGTDLCTREDTERLLTRVDDQEAMA